MKKKILVLLLLLVGVFTFVIIPVHGIEQDSITVVVDISDMNDRVELYNLIESYNIEVDDRLYIHSISVYGPYAGEPLITESDVALSGNPYIINNGQYGYGIASNAYDYIMDMEEYVANWYVSNIEGVIPLYFVITLPPLPLTTTPYTGFMNTLKTLIDYIYQPFIGVVDSVFDTALISITPGFGEVTWFTIVLNNLIYFIIAFIVYYIIIRLVYAFIKMPFKLFRSLF